jgi:hypothetical protein
MIPDEFTEEELKQIPRYSVNGMTTTTVPGNTELTITDELSFMDDVVHTIGEQTIPLHYQLYYRIHADADKEEVVLIDAIYHTHTFAEYLKYS